MRGSARWIGLLGMVPVVLAGLFLVLSGPARAVTAPRAEAAPMRSAGQEIVRMEIKVNGEKITSDLSGDGLFDLFSFENAIISPRDPQSGLPTGRRQYQPLLIRKRIDKSSPLLMKALTNNENVEATFRFYRPSRNGVGDMVEYYNITIRDAALISYQATHIRDTDAEIIEQVGFVFRRIAWTYTNGGVTHEDTWDTQQ